MKSYYSLVSVLAAVLTLFFLSCSNAHNEESATTQVNSDIKRIITNGDHNILVTTNGEDFSADGVLCFNTWDDVYALLNRWQSIGYVQLRNEYDSLGYTNDIMESILFYDEIYHRYYVDNESLDIEQRLFGEIDDDDIDFAFESELLQSVGHNIIIDTISMPNGIDIDVLSPIGELDLYALCNYDGYVIVDGCVYKRIEDVIISFGEADAEEVYSMSSMEELQHYMDNVENEIVIETYRLPEKARYLGRNNWTVESYWNFVNGYIAQLEAWNPIYQTWATDMGENEIGQYYSTVEFKGVFKTPRFSNQNSFYESSLTIVNYRKKYSQYHWHKCGLPTTVSASFETEVTYQDGFISTPTTQFHPTFAVGQKFYSKKLHWKSLPLNRRVELLDLFDHQLNHSSIDFDNGRTTMNI